MYRSPSIILCKHDMPHDNSLIFITIVTRKHVSFSHPQTKLREGNFFTSVCLFTGDRYLWSHVLLWVVSLVPGPFWGGISRRWVCWRMGMSRGFGSGGGYVLGGFGIPWNMGSKRTVRVLLACFLVSKLCLTGIQCFSFQCWSRLTSADENSYLRPSTHHK